MAIKMNTLRIDFLIPLEGQVFSVTAVVKLFLEEKTIAN